jgi:hypothetical protein
MPKMTVGQWTAEAERTFDAIRVSRDAPIEFWTKPMLDQLRKDATARAVSQGKPCYMQHVFWAAGDLADRVGYRRWLNRTHFRMEVSDPH